MNYHYPHSACITIIIVFSGTTIIIIIIIMIITITIDSFFPYILRVPSTTPEAFETRELAESTPEPGPEAHGSNSQLVVPLSTRPHGGCR